MSYRPVCHIKVPPPGKPVINLTTVSWHPQVRINGKLKDFESQLQWKKKDQSWSDPSVQIKPKKCDFCKAELDPDSLIQGEKYEARARVKPAKWTESTWSDWGPTESWTSHVGKPKPPLTSGLFGRVLAIVITGAVFALCLAVILLRNEKTTWVYKKIRGLPLPDPGESSLKEANFQNWSWPHVTGQLFHFSLIPEEIATVEVTSTVEKIRSQNNQASTSSSFSNPCYPESFSSLSTDNVLPCPANTLNVCVDSRRVGKTAEEAREEESKKKMEIQQLLSKENNNSEAVQVISDYERVERPPVENFDLQSPDSGMCSGEEASEESLEANNTCVMDEKSGDKEPEREERTEKVDLRNCLEAAETFLAKAPFRFAPTMRRSQC
ncbi:hypothetical protein INR49_028876 [Caranx melampygus]|nr:hypothetical protein INR49_028876 [Caranx melampygus]